MEPRLSAELSHLIKWAQTNTACAEYARWKAQAMALKNPQDFNELPVLLSNAVRTGICGPNPKNSTNARRSE